MAFTRILESDRVKADRVNQLGDEITAELTSAIGQNASDLNAHKADNVNPHPLYAKKAQENWINATLQNGWTGTIEYRKNDLSQVTVNSSALKPGTITGLTVVGSLPVGYRPKRNVVIPCTNSDGGTYKLIFYLNENGNIYIASDSVFVVSAISYSSQITFEVV